ncbi:hypothetical protein [Myroides odoratus]|uniref:hypothetical protein n=1 Tax=Myroides odoratus TaxID=256 RepID=UPI00333F78CD
MALTFCTNLQAKTIYHYGKFIKTSVYKNNDGSYYYSVICDSQKTTVCAAITEPTHDKPGEIEIIDEYQKPVNEVIRFKKLLEPVTAKASLEKVEYLFHIDELVK